MAGTTRLFLGPVGGALDGVVGAAVAEVLGATVEEALAAVAPCEGAEVAGACVASVTEGLDSTGGGGGF